MIAGVLPLSPLCRVVDIEYLSSTISKGIKSLRILIQHDMQYATRF